MQKDIKSVQTDYEKVYQREFKQVLLESILNVMQSEKCYTELESDTPNGKPKRKLSLQIRYEEIIKHKGVKYMLQKRTECIYQGQKQVFSDSEREMFYPIFIWRQLEEILNDESYNLIHSVTEIEDYPLDPFLMVDYSRKLRVLLIEMDMEGVDEWFKIQGLPIIEIDQIVLP